MQFIAKMMSMNIQIKRYKKGHLSKLFTVLDYLK
jgi:hypothetical protein